MHLGNLVTNKKSLESSSFSSAAKRIFESFFEYDHTLQIRLKNTQLGSKNVQNPIITSFKTFISIVIKLTNWVKLLFDFVI